MNVAIEQLTLRYPRAERAAVAGVSLTVAAGELLCITGPNGSGKSSLLRGLTCLMPAEAGHVRLDGRDIGAWEPRELARAMGVVTQREETVFPLRVSEFVMLGRYARLGAVAGPGPDDRSAVARALHDTDLGAFAGRRVDSLSGGEWQRARVARALAQEPTLLVLDEPTAALDIRHEMELFLLVRTLVDAGLAAVVVTHHLNVAARFADRLLLLAEGSTAGYGTPADVLEPGRLSRVFSWPVAIGAWIDHAPQVVPLRTPPAGGAAAPKG